MTRCKFKVDSITEYTSAYHYALSPCFNTEENKAFWDATPAGNLNLIIIKGKGKIFDIGKEYFIGISEAN